jgi:hypothetical protein
MRVERINEETIRKIALELGGPAAKHQSARRSWLTHGLEQRGLANARLSNDLKHRGRALLFDPTEHPLDGLALSLPNNDPRA